MRSTPPTDTKIIDKERDTAMLEQKLLEWVAKVVAAHNSDTPGAPDTFQMVKDVDQIIAEAFDHDPVLS